MKEHSVLDLFMIARVCHYDTEDEQHVGEETLDLDCSSGSRSSWYSHLATRGNKLCFSNKKFSFRDNTLNVLRLELILGYARVSYYSLHSVFIVPFLE